jgi:hypothetical protein
LRKLFVRRFEFLQADHIGRVFIQRSGTGSRSLIPLTL